MGKKDAFSLDIRSVLFLIHFRRSTYLGCAMAIENVGWEQHSGSIHVTGWIGGLENHRSYSECGRCLFERTQVYSSSGVCRSDYGWSIRSVKAYFGGQVRRLRLRLGNGGLLFCICGVTLFLRHLAKPKADRKSAF